jgi:tRNA/rRNA methyltransferase
MKNMGLQQLVLVNPQCDPLGEQSRLMAVRASDILVAAQQVATLAEALSGCQRAIATTGLDHTALNVDLEHPKQALSWLIEPQGASRPPSALIFGREDRGLTKTELNHAQRFIRIPTSPDYSSLNLAQAVAICCYELAELMVRTAPEQTEPVVALATLDGLEGYYQQLEALLLEIGYLYPHTAESRMEKFRRLFNRAQLSTAELAMLRGIVSQMEWALQRSANPFTNP